MKKMGEKNGETQIDRETWETALRCRKTVRRTDSIGEANPLTGIVFCADCGAKLYNHRNVNPASYKSKDGKIINRSPKDEYTCSTYTLAGRRYDHKCTPHYIRTEVLRELVFDAIKSVSGFVKSNKVEFIRQIHETSAIQQEETEKTHKKRIVKEQKRITELNTLIRRIYEDNINGKLTDKRYELLSQEYEQEQSELEQSVSRLQTELSSFNADSVKVNRFIEIVKRHTDFSELTAPMIAEYIEKIIVHEADRSSGERSQQVDIYLNFIDKFEAPMPELTPEELAAEEKARHQRAVRREAQRRYAAKQKEQRSNIPQIA